MSSVSNSEQAELLAFRELEHVVKSLGEELAGFRRRALQAEARVRELEGSGDGASPRPSGRVLELERENADLRARLDSASVRTRQLLDRVQFLRQQHSHARGKGK